MNQQGKVVTKEAVKDANGDVIKKGEALEVFLTNDRQVLITGKHPDGGNYFWPRGFGPKNIKPPSDEVWNFVLELANQQDAPKKKKHYGGGASTKRLNPSRRIDSVHERKHLQRREETWPFKDYGCS